VSTPNDRINTDNGRFDFTTWAIKINGTFEAPFGLRITPSLRSQSGQPYARTFVAGAANGINYGSQRILAEPIGTRHQDNISIVDVRIEKLLHMPQNRAVSVFLDGYNLLNTNAAANINWSSGLTFLTPSTIVPPRIARFGAKFDW